MIKEKTVTAILLVAGNSTRYGQNKNKNFETIHGKTILSYSLKAFQENSYIDNLVIGAKEEEMSILQNILKEEKITKSTTLVIGGKTRQETVYHCLQKTNSDIVIIHDGARPAIKQKYIDQCIESMEDFKGATIGVPSKDTIKITNENNVVIQTTKRSNTWVVQTPQCFARNILLQMHEKYKKEEVTDDCMLLEKEKYQVKMIEGDYTNIKLTTYEDRKILQEFLS